MFGVKVVSGYFLGYSSAMTTKIPHRGSEAALIGLLGGLFVTLFYQKIWRHRWYRGATMRGPVYYGLGLFIFVWVLIAGTVTNRGNPWQDWAEAWIISLILTLVILWPLTVGIWETCVYFTLSPRQRHLWHMRREITLPEAQAEKDKAFHRLCQVAPLAGAGAIWAAVEGNMAGLGVDAVGTYAFALQPLQYWSGVEFRLRNGETVYTDIPPVNMGVEFRHLAIEPIKLLFAFWLCIVFLGLFLTNGPDMKIFAVVLIVITVLIACRKKMSLGLTNRAIRRDKFSH